MIAKSARSPIAMRPRGGLRPVGEEADDAIYLEDHQFLGAIAFYYLDFCETSNRAVIEAMALFFPDARVEEGTSASRVGEAPVVIAAALFVKPIAIWLFEPVRMAKRRGALWA